MKGMPVENKLWFDAVSDLKEIFKLMDKEPSIGSPGFFETVTALAFLIFRESECDLALLEVGLGGRFDSTNTAEPEISLITNIGTDHQDMLGTGKVSIAKEKLGIIRKKRPLLTTERDPEILQVFKETTDSMKTELVVVDRNEMFSTISSCSTGHQIKTAYSDEEIFFPMPGEHQLENLALALKLIERLKNNGFHIPDEAITEGIKTVFWPGRLQWIKKESNTYLLDGAHNPEGLDCLLRYLKRYPPVEPLTIIFGTLEEKPCSVMASRLETVGSRFIYTPPSCGRALEPKQFLDNHKSDKTWETCTHISQALEKTKGIEGTVLITGSLYLLSDALREFDK
jgi:dihydrofolate synthase/folylpolyglutamate synthase